MTMDKVNEWLTSIALPQYGDNFEREGWDDMGTLMSMTEEDVKTVVNKPGHVRKILLSIHRMNNENIGHTEPITSPTSQESSRLAVAKSNIDLTSSKIDCDNSSVDTKLAVVSNRERMQDIRLEKHDSVLRHIVRTNTQSFAKSGPYDARSPALADHSCVGVTDIEGCSQCVDERHIADSESSEGDMMLTSVPEHDIDVNKGTIIGRTDMHSALTTNTIVKDSKNITIAKEIHIINAETSCTVTNFETQINSCLKTFSERKQPFVRTRAYKEAMDILEDRNWVVVIGNPGDGKSIIAHQLLLDHKRKEYVPIIVTSPQDWKQMVAGRCTHSQKQIVLIDDMFGVSNVNETVVNKWLCLLELMGNVVSERKGHLKVVCTNRKSIFNHVVNKVEKFKEFSKLAYVDLCVEPFALSFDEKVKLLTTYFKYYVINSDSCLTNDIEEIASIDFNYGFPHCVEIFCTNSVIRKQGKRFFEFPLKLFQNEVKEYQMHDKKKFCALLLVLLSERNEVCLDNLDERSDILCWCLKLSGISHNKTKYALNETFIGLDNVYLKREAGAYRFKHDSFREIIAMLFAKSFPKQAIHMLDLDFLVTWTELIESDESHLQLTVPLSLTNSKELAERWTREILNGNGFKVFSHKSWHDEGFQDCWLQFITTTTHQGESLLAKCLNIKQKHISSLFPREFGLLACFAEVRLERVLLQLLSKQDINSCIDRPKLYFQASEALLYSSFKQLSSTVLQKLIDAGADVNCRIRNTGDIERSFWGPFLRLVLPHPTPLMNAVLTTDLSNTKVLLKNGASLYDVDDHGEHIISIAVSVNAASILESLLQFIIQRGSHTQEKETNCGKMVCVRHFIEIDYESFFCTSVIQQVKTDDVLKVIMRHCCEAERSEADNSAVKLCLLENNSGTFRDSVEMGLREYVDNELPVYLIEQSPPSSLIDKTFTLHELVTSNRKLLKPDFCKVPLQLVNETDCNTYDKEGMIPLFYALKFSNEIEIAFLNRLLEKSNVNLKDHFQRNCLHFIAQSNPHSQLDKYIVALKETGVDINASDMYGNMPVVYASSFEVLEIFHKSGACFHVKNCHGADILMQILSQNASDVIEKVSFVLDHGADVQNTDDEDKTVLHYLVNTSYVFEIKEAVFRLLVNHGYTAYTKHGIIKSVLSWHLQSPQCTPKMIGLLISNFADMFLSSDDGVHFLKLLSHSKLSCSMKVDCLKTVRDNMYRGFGKELLESFLVWQNIDYYSCEQIISLIDLQDSELAELIGKTLLSEGNDHMKYILVKGLLSNVSDYTINFEKYPTSFDIRLPILASPKCLNLLRQHGLRLETMNICNENFEEIITKDNMFEAFRGYAVQCLDLTSILSTRQISFLANLFAQKGCFRSLSALLKGGNYFDFTIVDDSGNALLHNIMYRHGHVLESTLALICLSHADIDMQNIDKETPLFIACCVKSPELFKIRFLLKHHADINFPHPKGTTPLHQLMQHLGRRLSADDEVHIDKLCSDLVSVGAAFDRLDKHGLTPIMYLMLNARSDNIAYHALKSLLTHGKFFGEKDIDGNNLLHYVAQSNLSDDGKTHLCSLLFNKGVDGTSHNNQGRHPIDLTLFSETPSLQLCKQLSHMVQPEKVAQCLLNNVIHVTNTTMEEMICLQLMEMNISINWQDVSGVTCLSMACRYGNSRLVERLLRSEADPNISDVLGHSAIFSLLFSEKAIDISFCFCRCFGFDLLKELDFFAFGKFSWFVLPPSTYQKLKRVFQLKDKAHFLLHRTTIDRVNEILVILQLLLNHGADPNQVDIYGKTPLHYCAEAPLLDSLICPFMEILISCGADVNFEDFEGRTPIMLCAAYERTKYRRMNILIKAGADLFCKDYTGRTTHDYTKQAAVKLLYTISSSRR